MLIDVTGTFTGFIFGMPNSCEFLLNIGDSSSFELKSSSSNPYFPIFISFKAEEALFSSLLKLFRPIPFLFRSLFEHSDISGLSQNPQLAVGLVRYLELVVGHFSPELEVAEGFQLMVSQNETEAVTFLFFEHHEENKRVLFRRLFT